MMKLPEILLTRLKAVKKGLEHHEGTRNFSYWWHNRYLGPMCKEHSHKNAKETP